MLPVFREAVREAAKEGRDLWKEAMNLADLETEHQMGLYSLWWEIPAGCTPLPNEEMT